MISVEIQKQKKSITSFKIYGHSNYAEYGKDIICSAVTGISQGMFNAILKMCNAKNVKIVLDPNDQIQGKLFVLELSDQTLQILLKAMYYQLYTIKIQFPKYIKIEIKEV